MNNILCSYYEVTDNWWEYIYVFRSACHFHTSANFCCVCVGAWNRNGDGNIYQERVYIHTHMCSSTHACTHTQISVQIFIIPSPLIILKLLVYWRLLFHCKISGTIYLDPPTTTHNLSVEMALELVGR